MLEHRVRVKDSRGQTVDILVRLSKTGRSTWQVLAHGSFRYSNGALDSGYGNTARYAWIALYGGDQIDDDKLVLHLDDFHNETTVNPSGSGLIYLRDFIIAEPGAVTWELIGS